MLPLSRWVWPSSLRAGIAVKEQADPLLISAAPCLATWCLPPTCDPDRLPSATRTLLESNDASAVPLNLINYGLNQPLQCLLSITQPLVFYYSNRKCMKRVPLNCNPRGQSLGIHVLRCFCSWLRGHLSPLILGTTELASGLNIFLWTISTSIWHSIVIQWILEGWTHEWLRNGFLHVS